jgi:DNA-binding transcriptional LysR family regulator
MAGDGKRDHPRRDRLKQLRAFCHAARLRSISRAAEHIFASQPAVSQQIRTLEDELAVTLFERSGPRIALTPAGARLYQLASPLVEGVDRLPDTFIEQHHGVASGDLNVAAGQTTAAMVLPGYLREFRHRHPDVRINVRVADGRQRMRWLRAYEVDVVISAVDLPPPDLEFRPAFSSEIVFITPEDHPLAGRKTVDLSEMAAFPVVTHNASHYASEATDIILRQHGQAVNTVLEVDGWNVIKEYVEAGVGVSAIPDICLSERDRVWSIPASRYFPSRRYGVLTRRDDIRSLAADWFIQVIDQSRPEAS